MKYIHKDISSDNPNVSTEHPLKEFLILVGISVALATALFFALGWVAEIIATRLPVDYEKRLFPLTFFFEEVSGNHPADTYVNELVSRLLAKKPDGRYAYRASVICSEIPNAFALPGGRILVTSGLFEKLESENGLAFVLGHEIGHLQYRHPLRALGRAVLAVFLGNLVFGDSSAIVTKITQQVTGLAQLRFSRSQEMEADKLGLELVHAIYGHTAGATEFFERMGEEKRLSDRIPQLFHTHPKSEKRIEALKAHGHDQRGMLTPLRIPPLNCK